MCVGDMCRCGAWVRVLGIGAGGGGTWVVRWGGTCVFFCVCEGGWAVCAFRSFWILCVSRSSRHASPQDQSIRRSPE